MTHDPIDPNSTYTANYDFEKAPGGSYVGRWHLLLNDLLDEIDAAIAAAVAGEADPIDHGSIRGLADDDHTHYLTTARHDVTARHALGTIVPRDSTKSDTTHTHGTDYAGYYHKTRHAHGGGDPLTPDDIGAADASHDHGSTYEPAITTLAITKGGTGTGTTPTSGKLLIGKANGTYIPATLTAGSNIAITNGDGSITIEASGEGGGATTLDGLSDVVITNPSDNQFLRHNGTNWINETVAAGSGATVLNELEDVTLSGPTNGQIMVYNGSQWVNAARDADTVDGVHAAGFATATHASAHGTGGSDQLTVQGLSNVTVTNLADTHILEWDSTSSKWVNVVKPTSGSPTLAGLTDVTVTNPQDNQFLRHNGTNWINETVWVPVSLDDLDDVLYPSAPSNGQVLQWSDAQSNWIPASIGEGGATDLDGLTDVTLPSASQGDLLIRGSSQWQRLAAGTSGYFLRSNGPGANPSWAPTGGGGGTVEEIDWPQYERYADTAHTHWERLPKEKMAPSAYANMMYAAALARKDRKIAEAKAWSVLSRWDLIARADIATSVGFVTGGSTDNTTAFTSWISSASDGDILYFPPGTYRVNGPVNINKAITLVGVEGSIISCPSSSYGGNGMIQGNWNGSVGSEVDGIHIIGLRFNGAGKNQAQLCMRMRYTDHLHIENCYFYNWGITVVELLDAKNAVIENCVFNDFNYTGEGYGIYCAEYCDNVQIQHNYFITEAGRHAITGGAIYSPSPNDWCQRVVFDDNYIENNTVRAIDCHESLNGPYIITNNVVWNSAGPLGIVASRKGVILKGNAFLNNTAEGGWMVGQQAYLSGAVVHIEDNVLEDGLATYNCPRCVVYNNVLKGGPIYWQGSVTRYDLINNYYEGTLYSGGTPTLNTGNVNVSSIAEPGNGSILYKSSSGWALLPIGSNGQTLRVSSGMPVWQ